MAFKAVIFDLDGTLLDTIDDLSDSMNAVLKNNGFPTYGIDKYKYFVGNGMKNLVKRAIPAGNYTDDEIEEYLRQMKEQYALNWAAKTKPYPGIPELLCKLENLHIPKAVLSNKAHEFTVDVIRTLLPHWHFDFVYGEREGITRKPDPSGALEIAKEFGIKPSEIVFIGDTKVDMITAKNAGMYAVGVLWGFREEKELLENGSDKIIGDPLELLDLFK